MVTIIVGEEDCEGYEHGEFREWNRSVLECVDVTNGDFLIDYQLFLSVLLWIDRYIYEGGP